MTNTRNRGLIGKLIFWSVIAAVFLAITLLVLSRDDDSVMPARPVAGAPVYGDRENDGLLKAESPAYPGEGAAGLLEGQENASAYVNPVTPTGQMGGPAGQSPGYGQPGGVPSRVASQ